MKTKLAVLGILTCLSSLALAAPEYRIDDDDKRLMLDCWREQKPLFEKSIKAGFAISDPYVLYNIQTYTNNLLVYAEDLHDIDLLQGLGEVYETAFPYLSPSGGAYQWLASSSTAAGPSYAGKEVTLVSAQYVYLLSNFIEAVSRLKPEERTPGLLKVVKDAVPVVLKDHLDRWLFKEKSSSGCRPDALLSFSDFIEKQERHELCGFQNAVTDRELWMVAAAVQMLAAQARDPRLVPMKKSQIHDTLDIVAQATRLIQSRLTPSQLVDLSSQPVKGLNFDLGAWDAHPDYAYTACTGSAYPAEADKKHADHVGWDIGHATRFVPVFGTLHDNRNVTGQTFPGDDDMKGFANQLVYGTFNRNWEEPLFTNFMDGTNGWYRVGYAKRKNFGYAPFALSNSVPTGGYGFWSDFNPDMKRVTKAVWQLYCSTDPAHVDLWNKDYQVFPPGSRNRSLFLLMALPSKRVLAE